MRAGDTLLLVVGALLIGMMIGLWFGAASCST